MSDSWYSPSSQQPEAKAPQAQSADTQSSGTQDVYASSANAQGVEAARVGNAANPADAVNAVNATGATSAANLAGTVNPANTGGVGAAASIPGSESVAAGTSTTSAYESGTSPYVSSGQATGSSPYASTQGDASGQASYSSSNYSGSSYSNYASEQPGHSGQTAQTGQAGYSAGSSPYSGSQTTYPGGTQTYPTGQQPYTAPYQTASTSGIGGVPTTPVTATTVTPKTNSAPTWKGILAALIATCIISVGLGVGASQFFDSGTRTSSSSSSSQEVEQSGTTEVVTSSGDSPDWVAVAEAVRPATVTISVSAGQSSSTGSGVIWDTEGTIVTNNHVVSDATNGGSIYVTLYDGRIYSASIVGTDSTTDLAVIRLDDPPDDLVAARFTTSSDLQVGQEVMAIGSPLGLTDTVTTGVISALDRPVTVTTSSDGDSNPFSAMTQQQETVTTNAIQVDASLNPGNSGGPLFDSEGAVIGINSSIASVSSTSSSSAGSIGLGFAIPVDLVKNVVSQILENGEAEHAVLGVTVSSATVSVAGTTRVGAQIESVVSGGAADQAGLQEGDVVISIDGNTVESSSSLTGYVRRYNSGDQVVLEVVRNGTLMEVEVTLQAE